MSRKKASDARLKRKMLASRVRRAMAKLEREARRPVRCAGVVDREIQSRVDGDDDDPDPTRPTRESSEYDSCAAANDAFTRAVFARLAGGDTERGFKCLDAAGELGNVGTGSGTAEGRPASAEEEEEERRQSRRRKKKRERCLEVDTALWSAWRNGFLGASKKRQV